MSLKELKTKFDVTSGVLQTTFQTSISGINQVNVRLSSLLHLFPYFVYVSFPAGRLNLKEYQILWFNYGVQSLKGSSGFNLCSFVKKCCILCSTMGRILCVKVLP